MSGAELQLQLWHLRIGDISDADLRRGLSWLGEDEIRYFRACKSASRKRQFALGRLLLRAALSHLARERSPGEWRIVAGAHGRPELAAGEPFVGLNLAHSGDRIVLATGPLPALGIDLEDGRRPRKVEKLARRWFNPEEIAELESLPPADRLPWFYRCWTIKEAWSKARGGSLASSLGRITVTGAGEAGELKVSTGGDEGRWRFFELQAGPGFHCALACQSATDIRLISRRMTSLGRFARDSATLP